MAAQNGVHLVRELRIQLAYFRLDLGPLSVV
jgi:hypothetical protein